MTELVLVTGAAGVMGARLVKRLLDAGHRVRALVLPNDPLRSRVEALGCELREGDVSRAETLSGVCEGVSTVYHLAAVILSRDASVFQRVNRAGTAHLVEQAARSRVRHFVYVSSASVVYPQRTPYAESKLQAEGIVAASGVPFTIVRPTLVYDRGGGQELLLFLDYLRRFPIVPFIGDGSAVKRPVWAEDVVSGLLGLLDNAKTLGKTYNFSGAEPISMRELSRLLLAHHDRPRPFWHLPVAPCRLLARLAVSLMPSSTFTPSALAGIVNDADLDPSEAMRDLD
jgi:NADH dehydrogenase